MRNWLGPGAALLLAFPFGAMAAPIEYDCDTAGGRFSEIGLHQAGPDYRVRGTITPVELRSDARYVATATVFLQSADRRRSAGVQIMRDRGNRFTISALRIADGNTATASLRPIGIGEAVPFELGSNAGGSFALVGGQRIDLGPAIGETARVSVSCSTGQFHFSDLDWSPS